MALLSENTIARRLEAARFAKFVFLGGCSAAINWISRIPLERLLGFPAAVVGSYLIGMAIAFLLFRHFVFPSSTQPIDRQIKYFVLVNLFGVCVVWIVSMTLVYYIFPAVGFVSPIAEGVGHAIGIGCLTIPSYFGHRFLTFRHG